MSDLDAALLAAHAAGDGHRLAALYARAADAARDDASRGFFLTQAYVFALEAGAPVSRDLRARLVAMGRETP